MGNPESQPRTDVVATEEMILANNWASKSQVAKAKSQATDGKVLMRTLVDQGIIKPEALAQYDLLIHQQAQFPGFALLKKLGAGGMGIVYLARHLASDTEVALKVISARLAGDPEFLGRFLRETKALIGLKHPHLANVVETGESQSAHYLAMEYVNGPPLSTVLKEHRALPEAYALTITRQIATGLAYVYKEAGLVHRDIKPENILIQRNPATKETFPADDQAKLIDFGLVKSSDDDEHLTQTGMTIGTPLYMSPEQVRGEKLDCRSDIYGLGATLFHLLTGTAPFRGPSPGAIMSSHLTEPVPDPGQVVPALNPGIRRLVMTSMAKSPEGRFLTFEAFVKACDAVLTELDEKTGGGLRLLRKPLVIKKPNSGVRASGEWKPPTEPQAMSLPTLDPLNMPEPESQDPSARIQRKHEERKAAEAPSTTRVKKPPTSATRRVQSRETPGPNDAVDQHATGALIKVQTDRIRRNKALPRPAPLKPLALDRSATFEDEAAGDGGIGLIPWIFLGGAAAAFVAYLVVRMTAG